MLDREAGEEYKANKTNIVEVKQYGWWVSVCCTERKTELQICNIANLPLELNYPNTVTACIINTFLQIGNAAHRPKILRLPPKIIQYLEIHVLVTLCWADHIVMGSCKMPTDSYIRMTVTMQHFFPCIRIALIYDMFRPNYGHHQVYQMKVYHTALIVVLKTSRRNLSNYHYTQL
jgi:hypothetical protein